MARPARHSQGELTHVRRIRFPRDAESGRAPNPSSNTLRYCSRAAAGVDNAEVDRIIELSQRSNVARDITGVLVFGSGVFFQWIEGPPAQVDKLIASLHGDPRHYDIVTLDRSVERRARLYPNWEMERVGADDIRAVLQEALGSAEDENNNAALRRILEHLDSGPLDTLHLPPRSGRAPTRSVRGEFRLVRGVKPRWPTDMSATRWHHRASLRPWPPRTASRSMERTGSAHERGI